ncbi:MAG: hypothetical protein HFG26_09210 [Provencibacterium sp.]|jgi:hypothetical protein|nr:hypothetical protein [Provencibacterium sp.]
MQDLINQYQERLRILTARRERLAAEKRKLRGKEYFLALRRLDILEQECLEMSCALAWMVKEYGNRPVDSGKGRCHPLPEREESRGGQKPIAVREAI